MWENIDDRRLDSAHYSVMKLSWPETGMEALESLFPDSDSVDDLNFVLFSTSGVHGSYSTIEDCEQGKTEDITFLVVHSRLVALRYGNCTPKNKEDIAFLKQLREKSWRVVQEIGKPECHDGEVEA